MNYPKLYFKILCEIFNDLPSKVPYLRKNRFWSTCLSYFLFCFYIERKKCTSKKQRNLFPVKYLAILCPPQSTHRVAIATFWRSPSWWKNRPSLVKVGGARPPPFTISTMHHLQSCGVRSSWEGRNVNSIPLYVLCDSHHGFRKSQNWF
jgi:hypothetical protein